MACGYDDTITIGSDKGALLIRNSWGTGWANAGYAWMTYRYVTAGLATDWWSLVKAEWVDTGQFSARSSGAGVGCRASVRLAGMTPAPLCGAGLTCP